MMNQDSPYTLILGDCREHMPRIPDASVDLVAADLPYGTTNADWDKVLDFSWLWQQYERLLKPTGTVVLTASQPFTSKLVMSKPEWFRYELIWRKNTTTGFVNAQYIPLKAHENVLVFSPAPARTRSGRRKMTYNPQGLIEYNKMRRGTKKKTAINSAINRETYLAKWKNFPRSVLEFDSDRGYHPTQKPLALMEWIILTYSNIGELVLDNTMGSGTTIVAAVKTRRRAIGIEMLKEYYGSAVARVQAALSALPLLEG